MFKIKKIYKDNFYFLEEETTKLPVDLITEVPTLAEEPSDDGGGQH